MLSIDDTKSNFQGMIEQQLTQLNEICSKIYNNLPVNASKRDQFKIISETYLQAREDMEYDLMAEENAMQNMGHYDEQSEWENPK